MNKVGVAFQQLGDLDRSERFYKRAHARGQKIRQRRE